MNHAYDGTEPKFEGLELERTERVVPTKGTSLQITSPANGEKFSTNDDIVIRATVDLEKLGGRQVRFYYLDKKWKPIGHDDTAPFEATRKSPPAGNWDIYVAVHGPDWKIVSKSRVAISVGKGSSVPSTGETSGEPSTGRDLASLLLL